jgi:hypothetical protein
MTLGMPFYAEADQIGFGRHGEPSFLNIQDIEKKDEPVPADIPTYPEDYSYIAPIYDFSFPGDPSFRLGRYNYHIGTAYSWDSADLFNLKRPLIPPYETEGIATRYTSSSFAGEHEISTFYSLGKRWDDGTAKKLGDGDYAVRMKTHTDILDLAIHYAEMKRNHTDYEKLAAGELSSEDATIPVRWKVLTAGVSGEIGGIGIHAEGGHAWLTPEDDAEEIAEEAYAKEHSRFLIGVDYTFKNELYLILEYCQEGDGKTSPDEYTLNDRLGYLANERDTIGRDNVMVGAKYPFADMSSIELYNIINANDSSVILNPWFVWTPGDDISVKFSAQIPVGKEDSAVGQAKPSAFAHIELNF